MIWSQVSLVKHLEKVEIKLFKTDTTFSFWKCSKFLMLAREQLQYALALQWSI